MSDENAPLSEDERCIFSILGAIRFDAEAVAKALRTRPLSYLEASGLANMLEGKRPDGLRLQLTAQGKGWKPIKDAHDEYRRCIAIGERFEEIRPTHDKWIEAVEQLSIEFGLGESTIAQQLALFSDVQESEKQ